MKKITMVCFLLFAMNLTTKAQIENNVHNYQKQEYLNLIEKEVLERNLMEEICKDCN